MSKRLESIDAELAQWIAQQKVFFVASAPLSATGHVNCSPKGGDCFRILSPNAAAYLDYTGSGAETSAHVRENARIVIMFCAFDGPPKIVRLHGRGEVVAPSDDGFGSIVSLFPPNPGARAIIRIAVERVSTSCGFAVPLMDFREQRSTLDKWASSTGPEGLAKYRAEKNSVSIDGLDAIPAAR